MLDGLLLIDKPKGPTSHDVVAQLRRILRQKRIGHTGTLDPAATGLLVILLGRATRLLPFLSDDKEYEGTIRLGITTDTLDAEGKVQESKACHADKELVREAAASFIGKIDQVPPMVSAVKVGGRPLHKLARENVVVERAARPIEIYNFDVLDVRDSEFPEVDFRVCCSKGTYIRVLAADLGAKLGCGAHLSRLRRTGAGDFSLTDALELDTVDELAKSGRLEEHIISMRDALPGLAELTVDGNGQNDVKQGRPILAARLLNVSDPAKTDRPIKIVNGAGDLLCVAKALADIDPDNLRNHEPDAKLAQPLAVFIQP